MLKPPTESVGLTLSVEQSYALFNSFVQQAPSLCCQQCTSLAKKSFKRPQSSVQCPQQRPTIRTLLKQSHSCCMRIVNNKEIDKIFMCTFANLNCQLIMNNILGFLSVVFFC